MMIYVNSRTAYSAVYKQPAMAKHISSDSAPKSAIRP